MKKGQVRKIVKIEEENEYVRRKVGGEAKSHVQS